MKDIFISYRRDGGDSLAQLLYTKLTMDGYSVFYDVETLRSGKFNEAIYQKIDECTDFLLILPKDALTRCSSPKDWVRLEIEYALKKKKNIIPIMMRDFEFPEVLPKSIDEIRHYNGIEANHKFFDAVMDTLKNKLLLSKPRCTPAVENTLQTEKETPSVSCPVCKSEKLEPDDKMMDLINIAEAMSSAALKVYLFTSPFVLLFAIMFVIYTSKNVSAEFLSIVDKIISYVPLLNTYVLKGKDYGSQFMKLLLITFSVPMLMFLASFLYNKLRMYYYRKSIELGIYQITYKCEDCGNQFTERHNTDELIRRTKDHTSNPMYLLFPLVTVLLILIISPFILVTALTVVIFLGPLLLLGLILSIIAEKEKITLKRVKKSITDGLQKIKKEVCDIIVHPLKEMLRIPDLTEENNIEE